MNFNVQLRFPPADLGLVVVELGPEVLNCTFDARTLPIITIESAQKFVPLTCIGTPETPLMAGCTVPMDGGPVYRNMCVCVCMES